MRNLLIILFILLGVNSHAQFTYSGYIYNADGSGAANVPIKLYRRTTPNITGFTNQQNYNGHSYYRSTGSAFWLNAKSNCEAMGGHLVTVTSSGENNFIFNIWPSGWIGLTDEVNEGQWRWVTGETYSYSSWNGGEPNNAGNEDYVQFVGGGRWNDLPNNVSLPYVLEFDYIVTTSSWTLYKTVYTNTNGYYSISEAYDPSKEYYIQVDVPSVTQPLTNTDGLAISNIILGKTSINGLSFHRFDLNNDGKINIADQYYLFGRKAGRFTSWKGVSDTRLYTTAEYNAIRNLTGNVRATYPGLTSITTSTLTSGGTLNLYLITPGYSGKVSF
jgi:hypothetical protein